MLRKARRLAPLIAAAALLLPAGEALACPNCKEALAAQTGDAARLKDGYYYSIVLMIAMPFAILGTGTFLVARAIKRGALPEM
jgi:hypothetical protein